MPVQLPALHSQSAGPRMQQGSMPNPDLRQVTVLSKADWERIQQQLNQRVIQEERVRRAREEKQRMLQRSKEQVKNWTNTIAGQRQKKLEARRLREEKEEEERKAIDIEEATFQAEKRKEAIERAKTQQYYQTDRVKGFHGALLLTEVLKEREAQLELKRLKEAANEGKDQEWVDLAQQEYEEGILRDQQDAAKRLHKVHQTADFQKAQIRDHLKQHERELDMDKMEGDELKRLAHHYEMEKRKLEEVRAQEAKQLMTDNLKQIDDVYRMKEIQKQQEEEENEECRVFAAAKRKMMKLRADKEKSLHSEKQSRLEQIRQKLYAQMQQKKDDEDIRIQRAQEESEEKRAREEAEKEKFNRKMQQEMAEHRHQQMKENEEKIREERRQEIEMLRVRKQADEQFANNEREKVLVRLEQAKHLQDFHTRQREELERNVELARQEQLLQDQKNEELIALEEQQFQEYAHKVIDHARKGGRNVYPLQRAAQEGAGGGLGPVFPGKGGVRPSYMVADKSGVQLPNYQRSTTDSTKRSIYGSGQTSKRMGFVW